MDSRNESNAESLLHDLKTNIEQLERQLAAAQDTIRELEAVRSQTDVLYRVLFEESHSIKLLIDPDTGAIVDANRAACRFYGYDKEVLLTRKIQEINALPEEEVRLEVEQARAQQRQILAFRHTLSSGEIRDVEVFSEPIELDGRTLIYSIIHDVTDRKAEESQLRLLWHAVSQSTNSIIITNREGNIEYVNPYFSELTGYSLAELVGQNPRVIQSGQTTQTTYEDLWATLTSGEQWLGELLNRKKDGELYWERATISPVMTRSGEITHFVAIKEDITEEKRIWKELKQSEYTLRRSQTIARVGDWTWDTRTNTVRWSDEMYRIFGVDRETASDDLNDIIENAIHPDDRAAVYALNQAVIEEGKPGGIEYRIVWPDGTIRHVWAQAGAQVYDDEGKITHLSGIVQDITARKQIELQLEEAERKEAEKNRDLQLLNEVIAYASISDDPVRILEFTCDRVATYLSASRVAVLMLDEPYDRVQVLTDRSPAGEASLRGREISVERLDVSLRGNVADFVDTRLSPLVSTLFEQANPAIVNCIPIELVDESLYVLCAVGQTVSSHQKQILEQIARTLHQGIERNELHRRLTRYKADLEAEVARQTAELRRLHSRLETIFDTASEGILLVTVDGRIETSNTAFHAFFGRDDEAPIRLQDLVEASQHAEVDAALATAIAEDRPVRVSVRDAGSEELSVHVELTLSPVRNNENHLVCTIHDITHFMTVERMKNRFVSTVNHELRNPIAGIVLAADVLDKYYEKLTVEQRRRRVGQIRQQAQRLTELVNAVLDMAHIDERRGPPDGEQTDMSQLVKEIVEEHQQVVQRKGQSLQVKVPDAPLTATVNRTDIVRIWRNLLDNAVKYTPEGGSIEVRADLAGAESDAAASKLRLPAELRHEMPAMPCYVGQVEDNGYGISLEDQAQLFTRFYRSWAERSDIPGTGLGLALVRQLLKLYGGDIHVTSRPGEGSMFTFWIPPRARSQAS